VRWFIVFLIVANVILFFWVKQQSRPSPDQSAMPPPDVGRLRLLTEVEEERRQAVENPDVRSEGAAEGDATTPTGREPEAVTREVGGQNGHGGSESSRPMLSSQPREPEVRYPVSDTPPVPDRPMPSADASADEQVDSVMAAAEQSVAQAAMDAQGTADVEPDTQGGEARETTERSPQGAPAATVGDSADTAPRAKVAQDAGAMCVRMGPFKPKDADRLKARLPADIELLSDSREEYGRVDRYYVLIPALPSRAEGRRKLKELADAGFTDTWLFPSGEYRNAISMGFFSRESGARRHADNIASKGFDTEVRGKASKRQRRWLVLKADDAEGVDLGLQLPAGANAERQVCP